MTQEVFTLSQTFHPAGSSRFMLRRHPQSPVLRPNPPVMHGYARFVHEYCAKVSSHNHWIEIPLRSADRVYIVAGEQLLTGRPNLHSNLTISVVNREWGDAESAKAGTVSSASAPRNASSWAEVSVASGQNCVAEQPLVAPAAASAWT